MKKGLVLFVGECFREGGQGSRLRDTAKSVEQQELASLSHKNFINNVKEKYNIDIDVAINSYTTKNQDILLNWYSTTNLIFFNFNKTMIGLKSLINTTLDNEKFNNLNCYEFMFICRIDLFLKDLMFEIFDPYSQKLTFPFVCWIKNCKYKNMPRISDTMLFVPKQMLNNKFIINKTVSLRHESWYKYVTKHKLKENELTVYLNTYHDSDSAKDLNPLYYMVGRVESSVWDSSKYILDKQTMKYKKCHTIQTLQKNNININFSKKIYVWHYNFNQEGAPSLSFMYDPIIKSIIGILKEQYPLSEFYYKVNFYDFNIINEGDTLVWIGPIKQPNFINLKNKNIYTIYYNSEPDIYNPDSNEVWTYSKSIFNKYFKTNEMQIIKYVPIIQSKNVCSVQYLLPNNNPKLVFLGKFEYRKEKVEILLTNPLLKNNLIEIYTAWDDMSFNNIIQTSNNIFLNITKTVNNSVNVLPSVRINKLLSHKCIIISEHVNYEDEELYSDMIYFCNLNDIADVYSKFLEKTPMELQEISNNIYKKFSNKFNCKSVINLIISK